MDSGEEEFDEIVEALLEAVIAEEVRVGGGVGRRELHWVPAEFAVDFLLRRLLRRDAYQEYDEETAEDICSRED